MNIKSFKPKRFNNKKHYRKFPDLDIDDRDTIKSYIKKAATKRRRFMKGTCDEI